MMRHSLIVILLASVMAACSSSPPDGLTVVEDFDINRYTGRWYEIARLDHRFERGLSNVTAEYTLQENNDVAVLNRGYDEEEQRWDEAEGTAKFVDEPDRGSLKVSFFGPFYGGYHIIALDQANYQWAMISGPSRDYLWILARDPTLAPDIYQNLTDQARTSGFATDALIEVDQQRHLP
ncbi:lipocalin family protein [Pseudohongiella acticola]|jgi:apolipoprotein D and lipocalin family protein|uniref:lipocalin family protein n=1 Tax=Pseudohongiella acticola TaxID=1524254 RepID=UPI0030ED175D